MVLIELAAEVIDYTDAEERYFTIETTPIDNNWYEWRNRVIVRPVIGRFYSRQVDLQPGLVTIWVGVNNFVGYWTFRITAKVVSTGQLLLDATDYHPPLQFVNTYNFVVPNVPGGGGGGGGGATPDWGEIVKRMMENMLPPMMQMMGMMMMMQMMVGMMQSMVGAVGGAF